MPLRCEIGPKDMENGCVMLVRRDTGAHTSTLHPTLKRTPPQRSSALIRASQRSSALVSRAGCCHSLFARSPCVCAPTLPGRGCAPSHPCLQPTLARGCSPTHSGLLPTLPRGCAPSHPGIHLCALPHAASQPLGWGASPPLLQGKGAGGCYRGIHCQSWPEPFCLLFCSDSRSTLCQLRLGSPRSTGLRTVTGLREVSGLPPKVPLHHCMSDMPRPYALTICPDHMPQSMLRPWLWLHDTARCHAVHGCGCTTQRAAMPSMVVAARHSALPCPPYGCGCTTQRAAMPSIWLWLHDTACCHAVHMVVAARHTALRCRPWLWLHDTARCHAVHGCGCTTQRAAMPSIWLWPHTQVPRRAWRGVTWQRVCRCC